MPEFAIRTREVVTFRVRGVPVPQGSARAFVAGGRAHLATKTPALLAWRTAIATAASTAMGESPATDAAVVVSCTFYLARPKSAPKRVVRPAVKPDLDKLLRALLDGMTGIVFTDDSRVVGISADKVYGEAPGVDVVVMEV